jgi:hypothetical protein
MWDRKGNLLTRKKSATYYLLKQEYGSMDCDPPLADGVQLISKPGLSDPAVITYLMSTHFDHSTTSRLSFGWLFPAQQILLNYVLQEGTRIVVQLGAYLGKTTLFIAEHAPRALIFVIDPWDNAALKAEPSLNKNFANIDLFERIPFYSTFLRNTWHLAARRGSNKDNLLVGVVPLRMKFEEGIALLKSTLNLRPDVLYWEGFPNEAGLYQTLYAVKEAFPGVIVVGDGYNYSEVQKGLAKASRSLYQERKPFVEMGKCWTFLRLQKEMLSGLRLKYTAADNRAKRTILRDKEVAGASFKDLLSGLKSKSQQLKYEEAGERAARRMAEEEERDRVMQGRESEETRRRHRPAIQGIGEKGGGVIGISKMYGGESGRGRGSRRIGGYGECDQRHGRGAGEGAEFRRGDEQGMGRGVSRHRSPSRSSRPEKEAPSGTTMGESGSAPQQREESDEEGRRHWKRRCFRNEIDESEDDEARGESTEEMDDDRPFRG